MVSTANIRFRNAQVSHQIELLRLSGSINQKIIQLLNATEAELKDEIMRVAQGMTEKLDVTAPATLRKLNALKDSLTELRQAAMDDVLDEWTNQMRQLAVATPSITAAQLASTMPVIFDTILPAPGLLRALVTEQPFMGMTLKQWAKDIADRDIHRIMNEIRIGMVQGQSIPDIAARVVGSVQYKGKDSATQITRNQATSLTRTAVLFFSNRARDAFFAENADIIAEEICIATLDSRTTVFCMGIDGKKFPVGEGPQFPHHWGCRTIRAAIVTDKLIGQRPFNPITLNQLLNEFTDEEGLESVSSRDDLPHGTKGQFDEFARKRVRQLIGTTPASTTYAEFLKGQSAVFQDEVLGKTKGLLFRKGGLTLDRFVDRAGNELNLQQLVRKYSDAFIEAGLDPSKFF